MIKKQKKNLIKIIILGALIVTSSMLFCYATSEVLLDEEISSDIDMQDNAEYNAENTEAVANIQDIKTGEITTSSAINPSISTYSSGNEAPTDSDGAILCDSIIQAVKSYDIPDGNHIFRVNGKYTDTDGNLVDETKDYDVEIINYYDDVTYSLDEGETSKVVSLGDETTEHKMLIVKYHKNLTIDEGVTVTATAVSDLTYKKGMYLCVMGDLINNGTISMTARGTYNVSGENVYLWKNNNNQFEYIPADGAAGLGARRPYSTGLGGRKGNDGQNRGTGSGGQGASIVNTNNGAHSSYIGASTGGTSYSGGNGTGGMVRCNSSALAASYSAASSVNGGNGSAYDAGSNTYYFAGGGAGIVGGSSSYCRLGKGNTQQKAENGTGGLLILFANNIKNDGKIEANGMQGAGAWCSLPGSYKGSVGGGGSGRRLC